MDPPLPPQQPQQPQPDLIVHWNDFLVASLLGLPDVEIDRLIEQSRAEMMGFSSSSESPPASPSPAKRARYLPSVPSVPSVPSLPSLSSLSSLSSLPSLPPVRRRICRHRHLQLRSGLTFHFSDDDGKEILTTPDQEPNLFLRKLLSKLPTTVRGRLAFLAQFDHGGDPSENDVIDADMEETDEWFVPLSAAEADPVSHLFRDIRSEFFAAYLREMRMRRAFRTLVQHWRIRHIHQKSPPLSSMVDPITLQPPVKPVILYHITHRTRYVYDANTLSTWIESNLKHHQGGFASPQAPRNPLTNTPFTYPQLVSLYQQLRDHGELQWCFTTLRHHDFDRTRWHLFHSSALTLSAIRESMTRLDSVHAQDMLADFIFMKMDDLHLYYTPGIQRIYYEAISRFPTHWYLEALKGVAYVYYEAEHFGQNRRRHIHNRCDRIFQRQEAFLEEMREHGIGGEIQAEAEEQEPDEYE